MSFIAFADNLEQQFNIFINLHRDEDAIDECLGFENATDIWTKAIFDYSSVMTNLLYALALNDPDDLQQEFTIVETWKRLCYAQEKQRFAIAFSNLSNNRDAQIHFNQLRALTVECQRALSVLPRNPHN